MNLKQIFLTKNQCFTTGTGFKPKGVMVHSTGAANANLKRYVAPDDGTIGKNSYNNHWNVCHPGGKDVGTHAYVNKNGDGVCDVCGGRQVCVHAFIGKLADGSIATVQTLPLNMRGWHAGGSANNTHIGFEICEDKLTDEKYFNAVYKEAVEFTAYVCDMYDLDPLADGVVICHSEGHKRGVASNHADVMHWFPKFGKTMDDFRKDVDAAMAKEWENTASDYAKDAWALARDKGVMDGTNPKSPLTREQAAVVMHRLGLI